MLSGIVYFDEVIENIKDATGIENMRPLYNRIRRFIFNVENEIGAGGVLVVKTKEYTIGDGFYDGTKIIMPYDFVSEFSYGDLLSSGVRYGNIIELFNDGPDKIDFKYIGFLLDENGNPFTTRNRLDAVICYAVYRLYSSKVFLKNGGNANLYKMYKLEYEDAVLGARGNDAFPTEEEWNQLGAIKNGGAFEAMTDCGMKTIYTGPNNPGVKDTTTAPPDPTCLAYMEGLILNSSISLGYLSFKALILMQGVSNGISIVTAHSGNKSNMSVLISNGSTITATLSGIGSAQGSVELITVRTLGTSNVFGHLTIRPQTYCYTGIFEYPDPIHHLGGQVKYVGSDGLSHLRQYIWAGDIVNIEAITIIWHTGVAPCE